MSGRPLDVLEESLGTAVTVRLKSGEAFLGELAGYDQHMNVVLEPTTDLETDDDDVALGDLETPTEPVEDTTIIRGDNLVSIHP